MSASLNATLVFVEDVNGDVNNRPCTRCPREAKDDSEYCDAHHEDQKRRQRECMRRKRAMYVSEERCGRCGGVRFDDWTWCRMCLVSTGRIENAGVNTGVNKSSRVASRIKAWENSPTNAGRARLRGGRRGAPAAGTVDAKDLEYAKRALEQAVEQLAYSLTPEVKAMPRIQRADIRDQGLAKLVETGRWVIGVVKRYGYEIKLDVSDDDED